MKTNKKHTIEGFKAVKFMREVRSEINKEIIDLSPSQVIEYFQKLKS